MMPRLLGLLLLAGCAAGRTPAPAAEAATEEAQAVDEQPERCRRQANVTVHVDNRSSMDVQIAFGQYTPPRAAPGFSQTTYSVSRYDLESRIRLRIVGGGLEIGTPPSIATEPVACNDATLIIGPRPRYSFFYGDLVVAPPPPDSGR
jgi:hypothetical protein